MRRILVGVALIAVVSSCGAPGRDPGSPAGPRALKDVIDDPSAYDGRRITIEAAFLGGFGSGVLTGGFAESHPPQAIPPEVWVDAGVPPRGDCVERGEWTVWAERVVASGTFRFRADGGLGHLGAYEMALEGATLRCG